MAQPIIYTGQGAGQVLQGSQSLQALGQFAQSQQQVKRDELVKSIKDQDKYLELMKLDPVYSASQAANEIVAKELDDYKDYAADLFFNKKGPLNTTELLTKLQTRKSVAMGKLNMVKAGQAQMMADKKAFDSNPGRYYAPDFLEATDEFKDSGHYVNGLTAAYQDPRVMLAEDDRFVQSITPGTTWDNEIKRFTTTKTSSSGKTPEEIQAEGIRLLRNNPTYKLNWMRDWESFQKHDPSKIDYYNQKAQEMGLGNGLEALAALNAEEFLSQEKEVPSTSYADPNAAQSRREWSFSGNYLYSDNGDTMLTYDSDLSDSMGNTGEGIRLNNDNNKMVWEIPAEQLEISGGVKFPKGARIAVIPQEVIGDKVSYTIHPTKNKAIKVTVDTPEQAYGDAKMDFKIYLNGDESTTPLSLEEYGLLSEGEKGRYKVVYEKKIDINLSATGTLKAARSNLNMAYNNMFDNFYNSVMKNQKSSSSNTESDVKETKKESDTYSERLERRIKMFMKENKLNREEAVSWLGEEGFLKE